MLNAERWHCIRLTEHHGFIVVGLAKRMEKYALQAVAARMTVPQFAVFSAPREPYDYQVLYFSPRTANFFLPVLADVMPEECEAPDSPDDLSLLYHSFRDDDPWVYYFGRSPKSPRDRR